jgi:hypothetical protein
MYKLFLHVTLINRNLRIPNFERIYNTATLEEDQGSLSSFPVMS